jgi:hypothetical protein
MTPTRITKEDALQALLQTNSNLMELAIGLARVEERLSAMDTANQQRHAQTDGHIEEQINHLQERLDEIQLFETNCSIGTVSKEVEKVSKYIQEYPNLLWLFRNKTKVSLMWAAFGLSMFVLMIAPWADRRLMAALLEFAGLPKPIVELIAGS